MILILAAGSSPIPLCDIFSQFRNLLKELKREGDEERILDTMDEIVGWCSVPSKVFLHYLINEEIQEYRKNKTAPAAAR